MPEREPRHRIFLYLTGFTLLKPVKPFFFKNLSKLWFHSIVPLITHPLDYE